MTASPRGRSGKFRIPWIPGPRGLQWAVIALLVVGTAAFLVKGADKPADPYLRSPGRTPVEGFGEIAFRVGESTARRCALLAQTEKQRGRGLMDRTDLGGYDGMLFVFPSDSRERFYMLDTPLPLSIAWFDAEGRFVSATDMEPCLDKPDCPLYAAARPYRYALEVPRGGLAALGIGPGSVITPGGPCT